MSPNAASLREARNVKGKGSAAWVRSRKRWERAIDDLRSLERDIEKFYRATKLTDPLVGLRNAARAALTVACAAWENKESHGGHFRED